MKFHWPSFLLGYGAGVGSAVIARHLRPFAVELGTAMWRLADGVVARIAILREDAEDVIVEARARARGATAASGAPAGNTVH